MSIDIQQLISAFLIGLLGGTHCVVMCGGIVSAISIQQPGSPPSVKRTIFYNLGRVNSYVIAGMIFGGIGFALENFADIKASQLYLSLFASSILILMGLYVAGWLNWILKIEYLGQHVWKRIEPIGRKWIPIQKDYQAYLVGMVWGWLPCGLVYSVLIWAISSTSWLNGGLIMLAFGLGTLPNLFAMVLFANNIATNLKKPWVKKAAGLLIIAFGLYQGVIVFNQVA
jgi:sulfite exporter TauE/SafE